MQECLWCEQEKRTTRRLEPGTPRECPLCDHIFKGNGWDGIDAHWKSKHENQGTPYKEFWLGLANCEQHRR